MPFDPKTNDALNTLGIPSGGSQDDASEPIDLRTIPREKWDDYLCFPILLPPGVATYVAGMGSAASIPERDGIEDQVIAFHDIQPPYTIVFEHGHARLIHSS